MNSSSPEYSYTPIEHEQCCLLLLLLWKEKAAGGHPNGVQDFRFACFVVTKGRVWDRRSLQPCPPREVTLCLCRERSNREKGGLRRMGVKCGGRGNAAKRDEKRNREMIDSRTSDRRRRRRRSTRTPSLPAVLLLVVVVVVFGSGEKYSKRWQGASPPARRQRRRKR